MERERTNSERRAAYEYAQRQHKDTYFYLQKHLVGKPCPRGVYRVKPDGAPGQGLMLVRLATAEEVARYGAKNPDRDGPIFDGDLCVGRVMAMTSPQYYSKPWESFGMYDPE